jgi:hypothetical protein
VDRQRQVGHQLLQVLILSPQGLNLLAGSVSDGVSGEALLARFQELLGPGIEGSRSDTFSSAEIADGYLPVEAFQDNADLLFGSVLPAGCGSDLSDEGPGLLGMGFSALGLLYLALGHIDSFLDGSTLYPASGAVSTFLLSGFIPSNCVPLSLTFYNFSNTTKAIL